MRYAHILTHALEFLYKRLRFLSTRVSCAWILKKCFQFFSQFYILNDSTLNNKDCNRQIDLHILNGKKHSFVLSRKAVIIIIQLIASNMHIRMIFHEFSVQSGLKCAHNACQHSSAYLWKESHVLRTYLEVCTCQVHEIRCPRQ